MRLCRSVFVLVLLLLAFDQVIAQKYAQEDGEVAVGGYDVTSYFTEDLVKGKKDIRESYDGLIYQFANQKNLDKFKSNPSKYIPAYGGWCAMALCQNKFVEPNPKLFSIIDEKIHLFEVKVFYNGKVEWFKDPKGNQSIADEKYNNAINPIDN